MEAAVGAPRPRRRAKEVGCRGSRRFVEVAAARSWAGGDSQWLRRSSEQQAGGDRTGVPAAGLQRVGTTIVKLSASTEGRKKG